MQNKRSENLPHIAMEIKKKPVESPVIFLQLPEACVRHE
jgi:hypothetical protein